MTERINEFGAMKQSFFKESLEEEESIWFCVQEVRNNARYVRLELEMVVKTQLQPVQTFLKA